MKKRQLLLVLTAAAVLIFTVCAAVSAQDTDVENMDNEQLMLLLDQIMKRLNSGNEGAGIEQTPQPGTRAPTPEPTPTEELPVIRIYENKKLIVGQMPEAYFYRPPVSNDGGEDESPTPRPKMTAEQCEHYCAYEVCEWGDNKCYWYCYYDCIGEPLPDFLKEN